MKVFILNSGSSSIKFQIIETREKKTLLKGICERIGDPNSTYTIENIEKEIKLKNQQKYFNTHLEAIKYVLELLVNKEVGVVSSLDEIDAIGHRVVHGGEKFTESVIVDEEVIKNIEEAIPLAPLHNPANLKGIKVCMKLMPNKTNVAVFDTAFHQTLKSEKFLYAIPYSDYINHKIRKYGFHGTSVRYIVSQMENILGTNKSKLVVCHLGNGVSLTAVKNGKSVDTTMGFTPLAGIPMGTRSGDIDPSIVEYLCKVKNFDVSEATNYLNKKSGMLGLFGKSDNRDICMAMLDDDNSAKLAFDIFCSRIASIIGSYYVELGGIDALVFTGGIGENSHETRDEVVRRISVLGAFLNKEKNLLRVDEDILLSTHYSKLKIYKVRTNEELMIALDVENLVK